MHTYILTGHHDLHTYIHSYSNVLEYIRAYLQQGWEWFGERVIHGMELRAAENLIDDLPDVKVRRTSRAADEVRRVGWSNRTFPQVQLPHRTILIGDVLKEVGGRLRHFSVCKFCYRVSQVHAFAKKLLALRLFQRITSHHIKLSAKIL